MLCEKYSCCGDAVSLQLFDRKKTYFCRIEYAKS